MSASVRRWLANFYFVRRCSQVCLASVSQVMCRSHAGVRRSRNRRQILHVYRKCIAGVSQLYRKCVAGVSQLYCNSRNSHKVDKISMHAIQLSVHMVLKFDSVWKVIIRPVIITQFQCCKIFELESLPFHLETSKMVLVSQCPITSIIFRFKLFPGFLQTPV